jgi:hypothetical protein
VLVGANPEGESPALFLLLSFSDKERDRGGGGGGQPAFILKKGLSPVVGTKGGG